MTILLWHAVPGSGDEGAGSGGELRDQAGAGGGEAAVQHSQREPRKSTRHHQGAAAAEGKYHPTVCAQTAGSNRINCSNTGDHDRQKNCSNSCWMELYVGRFSLKAWEVHLHFSVESFFLGTGVNQVKSSDFKIRAALLCNLKCSSWSSSYQLRALRARWKYWQKRFCSPTICFFLFCFVYVGGALTIVCDQCQHRCLGKNNQDNLVNPNKKNV